MDKKTIEEMIGREINEEDYQLAVGTATKKAPIHNTALWRCQRC